jgi:hypothetical protein
MRRSLRPAPEKIHGEISEEEKSWGQEFFEQ